MHIADLFTRSSVSLSCRLFGALDQPGIGDEVLDRREAVDVVDLIEDDQGQYLTDAGHRAKPVESMGIMLFSGSHDIQLQIGEQLVVVIHQLKIDLDAPLHAGITEALGDSFAVGFISDFLADLGQIVLAVGVLDVGQEFRRVCASGTCGGEADRRVARISGG